MLKPLVHLRTVLDKTRAIDFLAPAALRIYLAPLFILSGMNKLSHVENVASYFEFLGIPAPELMVYVAGITELAGGWMLLLGLAVRWVSVPLMIMMAVAAGTAHWENGWHVLPETELTMPWEWREDLIDGALERRGKARSILREHGNYGWLTETGSVTILKNGVEFAATYFIMLLPLFFYGGGKLSLDHVVTKRLSALA